MLVVGTDIETTGLTPGDHRIIEIYAGLWNLDTQKQVDELNLRIDPQRAIQAEAQRVHGISLSDLVGKPIWDMVAGDVSRFLNRGERVVAHNGIEFDLPFINYELARVKEPLVEVPVIDTMKDARWATAIGKNPQLGELAFACEVPYDPAQAHKADYDVKIMMECFFRGLRWGFFEIKGAQDEIAEAA